MRLANELAAEAMEHVRRELRPGMKESEAGALWEGFVHGQGTGYGGQVELARGFSLVWSGPGIRTFTATGDRPVQEHEPTLFEIWVCVDGYWCDHTKNVCPGELTAEYDELLEQLLAVYRAAIDHVQPGASLAELDVLIRDGIAEAGYPGQPSHPVAHGVGARAHEPPYAHQAGDGIIQEGMVLAIEPGVYWEGGGGLRLEDNFLVTADRRRAALALPRRLPRGVIDSDKIWTGGLNERVPRSGLGRPLRHDAARRRADRRRRALAPRTSSRSPRRSTSSASAGSRPGSRASPRTTAAPSS